VRRFLRLEQPLTVDDDLDSSASVSRT